MMTTKLFGCLKRKMTMIKRFEHLYTIYNNAFKYTPIIYSFYKGYRGQEKDILLSYLILPLVLSEESKNSLIHSKSNSNLYTFCRKKENLIGIPQMVKEYKYITNECIQYGCDRGMFDISDSLHLSALESPNKITFGESKESKAAQKFAHLVRTIDIPTIYRNLGVVEL